MSEDNNNQNDQPTEEQQPSDETQAELREISEEELEQILGDHAKWVESDGEEGERADLNFANLQHADLREVNLQQADLVEANLQQADLLEVNLHKANLGGANLQKAHCGGANLQEAMLSRSNLQKANLKIANLQKAFLTEANLQKANLGGANLQKANLSRAAMQYTVLDGVKGLAEANIRYANLEGATGLLGDEFAQADVTGTKLPENISEFQSLKIVEETSKIGRGIFIIMLLACVYSWMTIISTNDTDLLTNSPYSPPPLTGAKIPLAGFYIYAPIFLVGFFIYLNFYLQRLWQGLASLPAIFPNGKRLDEMAYPWLLNGIVRKHFILLRYRSIINYLEEWIIILLVWLVVPITLMAFWLRFLPRHDWSGTWFHIGLIVISVAFAVIFYHLCALTLQGKEMTVFRLTKFWCERRFYYGVSVIIIGILFSVLSYGAIEGVRSSIPNFNDIKKLVPWAFENLGYSVFANLRERRASEIPSNYGAIAKEERLEFVKGANLKGRNLNYADMQDAFLVKSDLRGALLNGANLEGANLQQAHLERANLQEANIFGTDLTKAGLTDIEHLTIEQLSKVKTLYEAKLDPDLLEQVKKCCPHLLEKPKEEPDKSN